MRTARRGASDRHSPPPPPYGALSPSKESDAATAPAPQPPPESGVASPVRAPCADVGALGGLVKSLTPSSFADGETQSDIHLFPSSRLMVPMVPMPPTAVTATTNSASTQTEKEDAAVKERCVPRILNPEPERRPPAAGGGAAAGAAPSTTVLTQVPSGSEEMEMSLSPHDNDASTGTFTPPPSHQHQHQQQQSDSTKMQQEPQTQPQPAMEQQRPNEKPEEAEGVGVGMAVEGAVVEFRTPDRRRSPTHTATFGQPSPIKGGGEESPAGAGGLIGLLPPLNNNGVMPHQVKREP